jgi:hypothetical protein
MEVFAVIYEGIFIIKICQLNFIIIFKHTLYTVWDHIMYSVHRLYLLLEDDLEMTETCSHSVVLMVICYC